jgi:hypothetical protein
MTPTPRPTTAPEVALLRIVAQGLAGPREASPRAAVARLAAVQAQDLRGALRSVALRTGTVESTAGTVDTAGTAGTVDTAGTVADVVRALDAGEIVRSWPMRGTLHLVPAEDLPWMVELLTERPRAAAAARRRELGVTDTHIGIARSVLETALDDGSGRSRQEVLDLWRAAGVPTAGGAGYHLLAHLAQTGVVCQGPVRSGEQLFVLVARWVPRGRVLGRDLDEDAALAEIALRYVRGHGPVSEQDLARWTGLPLGPVRRGLAAVADRLTSLDLEGRPLHVAPELLDATGEHLADARRTMLLPGFDEIILGYADRSVTLRPEDEQRVVPGRNGVFRPTVVHDGRVVGLWRVVGSGARRRVEAEPFGQWSRAVARDVAALGERVLADASPSDDPVATVRR